MSTHTTHQQAAAAGTTSARGAGKHVFASVGGGDWEVLECRSCRRAAFPGLARLLMNARLVQAVFPSLRCPSPR